jgi:hypothetical protein
MSLSTCDKCWDDPCTCGWEYRRWTDEAIAAQRDMLQGILTARAAGTATRYVDPPRPHLTVADYQRTITIPRSAIEGPSGPAWSALWPRRKP